MGESGGKWKKIDFFIEKWSFLCCYADKTVRDTKDDFYLKRLFWIEGFTRTMCQPSPGPRCFKDSSVKLSRLQDKASLLRSRNAEVASKLGEARKAGNAREVSRLSAALHDGEQRVNGLETQIRHTQRDVDGTRTGQRALQSELEATDDAVKAKEIQARLSASEALRVARKHALDIATSGRPPMIRIAKVAA